MRRLSLVSRAVLLALLVATSVSAAPITIDPIIGVRGGKFGSELIDSGNLILFGECPGSMDVYTQCAIFNISGSAFATGVESITVHLASGSNPEAELVFESDDTGPGLNQFPNILSLGGNDFRFSGSGLLMCPSDSFEGPDHVCGTEEGDDLAFGVRPTDSETREFILGLNLNATVLAVNDQSVPEPATLLLMGTAAVAIAGRRLRKKTH